MKTTLQKKCGPILQSARGVSTENLKRKGVREEKNKAENSFTEGQEEANEVRRKMRKRWEGFLRVELPPQAM